MLTKSVFCYITPGFSDTLFSLLEDNQSRKREWLKYLILFPGVKGLQESNDGPHEPVVPGDQDIERQGDGRRGEPANRLARKLAQQPTKGYLNDMLIFILLKS